MTGIEEVIEEATGANTQQQEQEQPAAQPSANAQPAQNPRQTARVVQIEQDDLELWLEVAQLAVLVLVLLELRG